MVKYGRLERVTTYLTVWQYDEGTATCRLYNDGQKFRIHRTEGGIPTALGDTYIVVALFTFQSLTVDVTKF